MLRIARTQKVPNEPTKQLWIWTQTTSLFMVNVYKERDVGGCFCLPVFKTAGVELDFSHGYYYALLDLIDLFFDGSIDQTTFEECSRYIFGSKAYIMFTVDKLVLLLTRHVSLSFFIATERLKLALA